MGPGPRGPQDAYLPWGFVLVSAFTPFCWASSEPNAFWGQVCGRLSEVSPSLLGGKGSLGPFRE